MMTVIDKQIVEEFQKALNNYGADIPEGYNELSAMDVVLDSLLNTLHGKNKTMCNDFTMSDGVKTWHFAGVEDGFEFCLGDLPTEKQRLDPITISLDPEDFNLEDDDMDEALILTMQNGFATLKAIWNVTNNAYSVGVQRIVIQFNTGKNKYRFFFDGFTIMIKQDQAHF